MGSEHAPTPISLLQAPHLPCPWQGGDRGRFGSDSAADPWVALSKSFIQFLNLSSGFRVDMSGVPGALLGVPWVASLGGLSPLPP